MSLKSTWNHSDTSNRIITEPLDVRYTTTEVYYDVAPQGTGEPPEDVTEAQDLVEEKTDLIESLSDDREEIEVSLQTAQAQRDTAYNTWYANQNLANYQNYIAKSNSLSTIRVQLSSKENELNVALIALDDACKALDAANEAWATESETVEYKGGRFLGFEHHRLATMKMRYVGFTLSAATSCKAYFDTLYTRTIAISANFLEGVPEIIHQTANPSSVRIVHEQGDNYTVEIEVTEDDVALTTSPAVYATIFATENQRVYL